QLKQFTAAVRARIKKGADPLLAVLDETRETYRACKDICFDGNGYSDEWKAEAKKRGLDCEASVPVCMDEYTSKRTIDVFGRTGVLTKVELQSRKEVFWEIYCKKMAIEAKTLCDLVTNHIIPVAIRYQNILLENVKNLKEIYGAKDFKKIAISQMDLIELIADDITRAETEIDDLEALIDKLDNEGEGRDTAVAYHDKVVPLLESIRAHVDSLELLVDDQMWPLPKYRELLFIH
ncbi:MAG: glutamine synthetase type III, partial [Candidatus Methanomethylophilus sp.]|nr:glutamine synthetase type III [Methanomethylophilus sp.]